MQCKEIQHAKVKGFAVFIPQGREVILPPPPFKRKMTSAFAMLPCQHMIEKGIRKLPLTNLTFIIIQLTNPLSCHTPISTPGNPYIDEKTMKFQHDRHLVDLLLTILNKARASWLSLAHNWTLEQLICHDSLLKRSRQQAWNKSMVEFTTTRFTSPAWLLLRNQCQSRFTIAYPQAENTEVLRFLKEALQRRVDPPLAPW